MPSSRVDAHVHRRLLRRVHERIAHQIRDDLPQPAVVAQHGRRRFDRRSDRSGGIDGAGVADGVLGEDFEAHGRALERASLVETGEQQQVVDERAHTDRFLLRAAHRLPQLVVGVESAGAIELGVAADRRHRRAQLVGRVPDEPTQALLRTCPFVERLLDAAEHLVERDAEVSGFGAGDLVGDALREVARGDAAGNRGHALDRADAEAHDPVRHQREHGDDRGGGGDLDDHEARDHVVDIVARGADIRTAAPSARPLREQSIARAVAADREEGALAGREREDVVDRDVGHGLEAVARRWRASVSTLPSSSTEPT